MQLVPNKKVSQARTNEGSTITPSHPKHPPTHTNTQLQQSLLCKFINKTKPFSIELGVLLLGSNRNLAITEVQHQPVTIQTSYTSEDKIFHNTLVGAAEQCSWVFSHAGSHEVLQLVLQQLCLSRPGVSKREIEREEGSHTVLEGDLRRVESAKKWKRSSFTHPIVIANLYDSLSSAQYKRNHDWIKFQ